MKTFTAMKKGSITACVLALSIILAAVNYANAALNFEQTYTSATGSRNLLILVNSDIYDPIFTSLNQLVMDLEAEDYRVTITRFISGTAEELKDYMKFFTDLEGVIFIGDLPVCEFEVENDHNAYGYAKFPIDLFYMDLDGQWLDADSNGIYDTHNAGTGDLAPEVWLGRLTASPLQSAFLGMDEVAALINYFAKNHAYRRGELTVEHRALSYPDDDWDYFGDCDLDFAYSNITVINNIFTTNATDYKNRLGHSYDWIHLCAHSSPTSHSFKIGALWDPNHVSFIDIADLDPIAIFYNLFACSNCKYTRTNYMGGYYIFAQTYGLGAVGSAKTGSMLHFNDFYIPLGLSSRKNMGEAFKMWFSSRDLSRDYSRWWYYGMTLLGDPTLSIDPPISSIDSVNPSPVNLGELVTFTGSGSINTGLISAYSWRSSLDGHLSSESPFSTNSLSLGEHIIYFKVQDNKGRWSSEATTVLTVEGGAYIYGDPSGNGEVSAYDAAITAQCAVDLIDLTPEQFIAAEVSGNGSISAFDASLIAQYAVGLIDHFPVEEP